MEKMIQQQLTAEVRQEVMKALNESRDKMKAVTVGLSDAQKSGARTMAEGREGLARMVSKIASAHVNSLAREHDPAELESKLAYDASLEDIRQVAMALTEMVTETQMANSIDIMRLVDTYVENLQSSRKHIEALDTSMREVDDYNKRFGTKPVSKTEEETPPVVVN